MLMAPQKFIHEEKDMLTFAASPAHILLCAQLERFCLLVKGVKSSEHSYKDTDVGISRVTRLLDVIEAELDLIPVISQPMRFGNKAFRTFHARLTEIASDCVREISCVDSDALITELVPYLLDSFGNPIRIDYGTGHELAYFAFLVILMKSKYLPQCSEVVNILFRQYLRLVRKITSKYSMEPAGSHGVWGLDDYHHLSFLFGAAQLIGHESTVCAPAHIFDQCIELRDSFMFAEALAYVKETKCTHAPFSEVSPILSDLLRRTESWSVCCYALLQMYKSEVLGKKPVIQHFFFGTTFLWK